MQHGGKVGLGSLVRLTSQSEEGRRGWDYQSEKKIAERLEN